MSDFAAQIKQARTVSPSLQAPPQAATPNPAPTAAPAPTEAPAASPGLEFTMPQDGDPHPEFGPIGDIPTTDPTVQTVAPEPKTGKIRIGTEVFDSPEEAIQYANDLQLTMAQRDAIEQYKSSQNPVTPEKKKSKWEGFDTKIFENPEEAAEMIYAKAKEDAKSEIQEASVRQEALQKTWNGFYSSNADLVESKDLVDLVLQRDWNEVGHMPSDKALALIAQRTRALLGSRRESTLPSRELQNKAANVAGVSSVATPMAPDKKQQAGLDFISQVRKHGKRT